MTAPNKRRTEAWRSSTLFTELMGEVIVARFKGVDEVEAGVFLVDIGCLGVKNAFFTRVHISEYEQRILRRGHSSYANDDLVAMSPGCARKFLEGAVLYAQSLGLAPHSDYRTGCRVFGGINAGECPEHFVYGKDGKPFFMPGPHDSPQFVEHVMAALNRACGKDGFHYAIFEPMSNEDGNPDIESDVTEDAK
jgi:hypothetical protein